MSKLGRIEDHLHNMDKTLASQHEVLKEHVRRTELLEKKMEPVEKHVNMVTGAIKFIGLVGIIAGIIEALHRILK